MSRSVALAIFFSVIAFFAFFFVLPLWETVKAAFISDKNTFTLQYVWNIFASPIYREGLVNSLIMAVGSTAGCLLISLPLALVYSKFEFPGRTVLNALVLLPMILPPFVGAIGVRAMLGQAGALNSLLIKAGFMDAQHPADWLGQGQMTGIIIMNVLHLFPILYLNIVAALSNLDPALEEAAANLGCPPQMRFWRITLPLIMPGIFAGGTIVFIWAFTELGVPLVFDFRRVTSVQIFDEIKDLSDNPLPYALVVIMLLFTVVLYLLSKLVFERGSVMGGGRATTGRVMKRLPMGLAMACSLLFALCIAISVIPHLGVLLLSVSTDWYGTVLPEGLTLKHFGEALGHELTLPSVSNSLKYASLAVILDLVLGIGIAYVTVRTRIWGRHLLDAAAMLPLAVPGLVLAFGFLAMSREGKPLHWLMLGENPLLLLVIAYAVRRLPYVVRSASAGFQQISPELEYAAQNLGAPPLRALARVTLPLIMPNLIAGGLLAFAFAMLEVSDSMILAQQSIHYPITKAIYALVASLGNGPYLASALGVWAMVFLGITLLGAGLLLGRKLGTLFRA
ncbi:iron(III) transport system permease protein [Roseimicrobium gellanilyticum]|uniref:Iron(III) transport system permease protein n=1 Tax=Roseimicrobium gellanilyticum TaxID=748857 RepID=A0A366HHE9_9BACT|nr:iron ABC transporter permease [Roseimicrobium gellanilyticum]RBP41255.1 iron(III) transport system permease protein [Roseimicrobium gellanilyticum]